MNIYKSARAGVHELLPIFFVAVAVALASTLVGSVLDHVHQVNAEELNTHTTTATDNTDGTQTLAVKDWDVQVALPLARELPLVNYAVHTGSSIGLSSADVQRLGLVCQASRNALGVLLRTPLGATIQTPQGGPATYFIATIGGYEYRYQMPQNACADQPGAQVLINRETSAILSALDALAPTSR
jgi:hypothetical protein